MNNFELNKLLSPIRDSQSRQIRTAKIVRLKRLSEQCNPGAPKKLLRRETMSRASITRESQKLNEANVEFQCEYCDKQFYHYTTLEVHRHTHDDTLPRSGKFNRTRSVRPHLMDRGEQTKFFANLSKELDDELKHDKKRQCNHCGKRFKRKTALKIHRLLRHS